MAPKKKIGKGSKGGKSGGGVIDGVPMAEMNRDQLEQFALKIRQELEREREERNFFQLERDKLRTFWEITRQQLEEFRATLRNKDRAIEEANERHEEEVKEFKQKIKHLMYEHTTRLAELQAENMVMLRSEHDQHNHEEIELQADKRILKKSLQEMKDSHDQMIRDLELKHSEELKNLRDKYELDGANSEVKYKNQLEELRECLNVAHDTKISEIEEQKNAYIHQLIITHEKALEEIKLYYNDITLNNLGIISTLKDQMVEMKKREEKAEKQMVEIKQVNKKLTEPLKEAELELNDLRKKVNKCQQEKQMLNIMKKQLAAYKTELNDLKTLCHSLEIQYEQMKKERNEYHDNFVLVILELQQKSDLKNSILQKKMDAMMTSIEKREAQIAENTGFGKMDVSFTKIEDILNAKNSQIKKLENKLANVIKTYQENVSRFKVILNNHGIHFDSKDLLRTDSI